MKYQQVVPFHFQVDNYFNFIVKNVGNPNLKQESVTAYEVAYTGTFKDKTTIGIALYRNETDDNINFASIQPSASFPAGIPPFDVYTPANAPAVLGITTSGVFSPSLKQSIAIARVPKTFEGDAAKVLLRGKGVDKVNAFARLQVSQDAALP